MPLFNPDLSPDVLANDVVVNEYDCIVVTQSCDLENDKAPLVALCPAHSLMQFEEINPRYKQKGHWEQVRQGRVEGLHLLASPNKPSDNRSCLVVNFREIYSLPVGYLRAHAEKLPNRWQLQPPYLEHFSQSFARFFMRVGLPSSIAAFK